MRRTSTIFKVLATLAGLYAIYAGLQGSIIMPDTIVAVAFGILLLMPNRCLLRHDTFVLLYYALTIVAGCLLPTNLIDVKHHPWAHVFSIGEIVTIWILAAGSWSAALSLLMIHRSKPIATQIRQVPSEYAPSASSERPST